MQTCHTWVLEKNKNCFSLLSLHTIDNAKIKMYFLRHFYFCYLIISILEHIVSKYNAFYSDNFSENEIAESILSLVGTKNKEDTQPIVVKKLIPNARRDDWHLFYLCDSNSYLNYKISHFIKNSTFLIKR